MSVLGLVSEAHCMTRRANPVDSAGSQPRPLEARRNHELGRPPTALTVGISARGPLDTTSSGKTSVLYSVRGSSHGHAVPGKSGC
jgi:hypothetical protein